MPKQRSPWGIPRAVRAATPAAAPKEAAATHEQSVEGSRALRVRCCRCGREFVGSSGHQRCPACKVLPRRKEPNRIKHDWHLRDTYGITLAEYEALHERQRGLCAICGRPETQVGGRHGSTPLRLAVDHDHATGAVRGLLCSSCNQGIGYFKHESALLTAAIAYLRRTQPQEARPPAADE